MQGFIKMPKENLTQLFVDTTVMSDTNKSKVDYFDTKIHGLFLKVLISGKKSFYLRYKNQRGKTVEKLLSKIDATALPLCDARALASKYLSQIALGEDPFEQKKILKQVPLVSNFIMDNYLPFVKNYKKSWSTDECLIRNHLIPTFGKKYMDEVSKKDVIQFISSHAKTHKNGSVNRVIILLRYIFNLAIKWETIGVTKNPTSGIPLLEENNKKERYLTSIEANKLIMCLKDSDNKMLQYIIPMLILTGARKNEVLQSKWEDFNLEKMIWRIPVTKSGKARHVPISQGVVNLLQLVPRNCAHVFANPKTCKPFVSIFSSWNTARRSVGLEDVRIHDLRHSFASFLVNNGRSIYEVQKILGHTQIKTTQRYSHLSNESLISAANVVCDAVPFLSYKNDDVMLLEAA
jgi:integrase